MSDQGVTDFAAVLDELIAQRATSDYPAPQAPSLDYLDVVEELHSGRIAISAEHAAAEYLDLAERLDLAANAPGVAPAFEYPDTTPEGVARELALSGRESAAELDSLRRRFAATNHPDRVVVELRQHAMSRMQIANRMIDDAKSALARN